MLRVPGDLPPEDGAAGAHGVAHGGDALQGQAQGFAGLRRAVGEREPRHLSLAGRHASLPARHLWTPNLCTGSLASTSLPGCIPGWSPSMEGRLCIPVADHTGSSWVLGCVVTWALFVVLLLLPAVHAEERPAEPHDQAARSPQAPRSKCWLGLGPVGLRWPGWTEALWFLPVVGSGGPWGSQADLPCPHLALVPLPIPPACSAPPAPSASSLGLSCSCMRPSSTAGRSCLCARSVGTGPRAATGCRCTSRPSTGVAGSHHTAAGSWGGQRPRSRWYAFMRAQEAHSAS